MTKEDCLWALDYALANAKRLRQEWAIAKRDSYDDGWRARRWMIGRPGIIRLMKRVVELEDADE